MRKRKLFLMLLLVLLPIVTWAQHFNIKQTNGDSISYFFSKNSGSFRPIVKDGKVVWSFNHWIYTINEEKHRKEFDHEEEVLAVDNVESIIEYEKDDIRKALIEFYHAMNGENWVNHENWCSDNSLNEWYGIWINENGGVYHLWLPDNNLSGELPKCITRLGPIYELDFANSKFNSKIPAFLENLCDLEVLDLMRCGLKGSIPDYIGKYTYMRHLDLSHNEFDGPIPEKVVLELANRGVEQWDLSVNHFSGKVPESIKNHTNLVNFWPYILIQDGKMDYSDLVIPAPTGEVKLSDGSTIDLEETYKKNKYTLLYVWCWSDLNTEVYNQRLIPAYTTYKDKGLEIIGFHEGYEEGLPDFLKTHTIPWRNCMQDDWPHFGVLFAAFWPQVHLVDQNGNIVFTSHMDEKGNDMRGGLYRDDLFTFLEEKLGPVDYDLYTSTDYSKDGVVTTLQTATTDKGIDLVFVGEGFTDKDISEGIFDQRMNEALNQFFIYEPYHSLQDRFNVYAVKTVSPNAEFYGNATHAIDEDLSKALEYASKVPNLNPNSPMRINVIYNNKSGGRSYCHMIEDNSYVCFAMEGANEVLNHEGGGHGIGRLFDEYVEGDDEYIATMPDEKKAELDDMWITKGYGANVDWRRDPTEVKWAKFISDPRYADEKIGVYEGSFLYLYGAYRPTENSMMRHNDMPFNAPSREEIYKRVMKESEGDGWTYDYETFVEFDAPGRAQFVDALSASAKMRKASRQNGQIDERPIYQRTAPPVFLKGTWRDALKSNKNK